jgi:phosphatidylserine/phosphatidylglycerophosphate/cardiolipin synthase-like enzyme
MASSEQIKFQYTEGIGPLLESIDNAQEFLKIVSFQLTSIHVITALEQACQRGVKVSVITLPPDSYAGDRSVIEALFERLRSAGVDLSLCIWEVGEPRLTTTSLSGAREGGMGQKWYSLHGKFLVSELAAQISSSNCTDENRLECYLELYDESSISEFDGKFSYLKETFVDPNKSPVPGSFWSSLPTPLRDEVEERFSKEGRLIVKDYPEVLCPTVTPRSGLSVSPFEGKARDILATVIDTAEQFLFLSSERFFDEEITELLLTRLSLRPLEVKVLAGPPQDVRQAPAKARSMLERLLAAGCEYASPPSIHAKLWLSDKWVVVGSANLTKMNLGFAPSRNSWRGDTQVLYMRDDPSLIGEAAIAFREQFDSSPKGISVLAGISSKIQAARSRFRSIGLKCSADAAALMARLESHFSIESIQKANEVSRLAAKLVHHDNRERVDEEHVAMAAILLLLRERRHQEDELAKKLSPALEQRLVSEALLGLAVRQYATETTDGWAIDIDTLVRDEQ